MVFPETLIIIGSEESETKTSEQSSSYYNVLLKDQFAKSKMKLLI